MAELVTEILRTDPPRNIVIVSGARPADPVLGESGVPGYEQLATLNLYPSGSRAETDAFDSIFILRATAGGAPKLRWAMAGEDEEAASQGGRPKTEAPGTIAVVGADYLLALAALRGCDPEETAARMKELPSSTDLYLADNESCEVGGAVILRSHRTRTDELASVALVSAAGDRPLEVEYAAAAAS